MKTDPEDLARRLASGVGTKKCPMCGGPAAGSIRSLAQESELMRLRPNFVANIIKMRLRVDPGAPPQLPTFESKYGRLTIISEITPCRGCFPAAERAAAKHPSWILVEIDEPYSKRIVGSVPVTLRRRDKNAATKH